MEILNECYTCKKYDKLNILYIGCYKRLLCDDCLKMYNRYYEYLIWDINSKGETKNGKE